MTYSFEGIKESVRKWVNELGKEYCAQLSVELISDTPEIYSVVFDTKNCMAQVIVHEPQFAPYRNVFFQVFSIAGKSDQPVFTWFDCNEDGIKSIIKNLQLGIEFALNYIPAE